MSITSSFPRLALSFAGVFLILLGTANAASAQTTFSSSFSPSEVGVGSTSRLFYQIDTGTTPHQNLEFTNTLPAGISISDAPNMQSDCMGVFTAPPGGNTITFSLDRLGSNLTCTIGVNVLTSSAGSFMNVTGDLISNQGNSGNAFATLEVNASRPGFYKSITPDTVPLGSIVTMTYTIDTSLVSSSLFSTTFAEQLPTEVLIAQNPNVMNTCGGNLTATPGARAISYQNFNATIPANSICTISVDLEVRGSADLVSDGLSSSAGSSGFAAGRVETVVTQLALEKSLRPAKAYPGGTVALEVTLRNLDRNNSASNVVFTETLGAPFAPTGLPLTAPCGANSVVQATADGFELVGGELAANGGACTFEVDVDVPSSTSPGVYTLASSGISADVNGRVVTGVDVSLPMQVAAIPLLEVTLSPDPVSAADTVTATYTITNPSITSSATNIAFLSTISNFIPGVVVSTPPAGFCGAGSNLQVLQNFPTTGDQTLSMSSGSLASGASCTFSVDFEIPVDAPLGVYEHIVNPPSATIDGSSITGFEASAEVRLYTAPKLRHSFVETGVAPGNTIVVDYILFYNETAPAPATSVSFVHDLDAVLPGLTALGLPLQDPCGPGSQLSGTSFLSFTGGTVNPLSSCNFQVTYAVPANAPIGSFTSQTGEVNASLAGLPVTSRGSAAILHVETLGFDMDFLSTATFGDDVELKYTIENFSSTDATGLSFSHNLGETLQGLVATGLPTQDVCGAGSEVTGTGIVTFTGGSIPAGGSCTFTITLQVPEAAPEGEYPSVTAPLTSTQPHGSASATLVVTTPLEFISMFDVARAKPGDTVNWQLTLTNNHPTNALTDITWTSDLTQGLAGLMASGLPAQDVCGAGSTLSGTDTLTLADGQLDPGQSCTVNIPLLIPDTATLMPMVLSTSQVDAVMQGTNIAQLPTSASIDFDLIDWEANFTTAEVNAGEDATLAITLTNLSSAQEFSALTFIQDLEMMLPGTTASQLPLQVMCGSGAVLAGTTVVQLTNGALTTLGNCTFEYEITIPEDAPLGSATTSTSVLYERNVRVAPEVSASIDILEPIVSEDMGSMNGDMGMPGEDMGTPGEDMGVPDMMSGEDMEMPGEDMGTPGEDMATGEGDMGMTGEDMGTPNGGGNGEDEGCGCATSPRRGLPGELLLLLGFGIFVRIRRARGRGHE